MRIRPEQLQAFASPAISPARIARALRDLRLFDAANPAHLALIGAAADDEAALRRFVAARAADARAHGIEHRYLVLHFAGFFFRFGAGWPDRDGIAALLGDRTLTAAGKMEAVRRRLTGPA